MLNIDSSRTRRGLMCTASRIEAGPDQHRRGASAAQQAGVNAASTQRRGDVAAGSLGEEGDERVDLDVGQLEGGHGPIAAGGEGRGILQPKARGVRVGCEAGEVGADFDDVLNLYIGMAVTGGAPFGDVEIMALFRQGARVGQWLYGRGRSDGLPADPGQQLGYLGRRILWCGVVYDQRGQGHIHGEGPN